MSIKNLADEIAARGRNGDTELVHMSKGEVAGLQGLAEAAGGSLTINPDTGKPEAFFLAALLPTVLGAAAPALGAAATGAGMTGLGGILGSKMGAAGLGALAGGLMNRDNPLMGAALGGLGGFGGFGLGQGLMNVGAGVGSVVPGQVAGSMVAPGAAITPGSQASMLAAQNAGLPASQLAAYGTQALPTAAPMSAGQQMMSGIGESFRNPSQFVQALGGPGDTIRTSAMAAAPLATSLFPSGRSRLDDGTRDEGSIPEYDFAYNPTGYSTMGSDEVRHFRPTFTRRASAGGIMSLAEGGMQAGGFVVPADVVALLGEGNTEAGYATLEEMFPTSVAIRGQDGGQADTVETTIEGEQPAAVAHGEVYLPPEEVERAGGAKKLYAMLENVRQQAMGTDRQIRPVDPESALA